MTPTQRRMVDFICKNLNIEYNYSCSSSARAYRFIGEYYKLAVDEYNKKRKGLKKK